MYRTTFLLKKNKNIDSFIRKIGKSTEVLRVVVSKSLLFYVSKSAGEVKHDKGVYVEIVSQTDTYGLERWLRKYDLNPKGLLVEVVDIDNESMRKTQRELIVR